MKKKIIKNEPVDTQIKKEDTLYTNDIHVYKKASLVGTLSSIYGLGNIKAKKISGFMLRHLIIEY